MLVRQILKLRERNIIYTSDKEEDEMIGKALINICKFWLIAEPKHTDFIKETIVENTESKMNDSYEYFKKS